MKAGDVKMRDGKRREVVVVVVGRGSKRGYYSRIEKGAEMYFEKKNDRFAGIKLPITIDEFESIGVACDIDENGCMVYELFFGTRQEVEKWLNTFGGCDIFRFDRYDLCGSDEEDDIEE